MIKYMTKYFCLAAGLVAVSSTATLACSPEEPRAMTDPSYEQKLTPYLTKMHRNMVDSADYIAIGTFKYSERKQMHRLKISETIKHPKGIKRKKRVSVTFNRINDDRVDYNENMSRYTRRDSLVDRFAPSFWSYRMPGSYDPGDCRSSLRLNSNETYLVFANEDFKITSMLFVNERMQPFQDAVEEMVKDPNDPYGISFSMKQTIENGNEVKILQTATCSPRPSYKILQSSEPNKNGKVIGSQSILVFEDNEDLSYHDLSKEDYDQALRLGQESGLYTNAPALETCAVGQKFLMLGQFLYNSDQDNSGQWIPEKNGYFDLSETAFEYHMTPEKVTFNEVSELLTNLDQ